MYEINFRDTSNLKKKFHQLKTLVIWMQGVLMSVDPANNYFRNSRCDIFCSFMWSKYSETLVAY